MADELEAERQAEDEGGPVKSFLEHLEDLRWVLIKCGVAVFVAMLVCLLAGNYLMRVLEWPLRRAPVPHSSDTHFARLTFGTNQIATFNIAKTDILSPLAGTNEFVRLQIVPVAIGTNQLLCLNVQPETSSEQTLPVQIINLSPAGAFVVATKVAFYGGLLISAPLILYFIAEFIFPALRMREKKYIFMGLLIGGGLFFIGVSFCYFILMPIALTASMEYANWLGLAAFQWRAEDYISFVCKFMLGMGLGFEMPVVVLTIVKIGLLNYRTLAAARRYVIVICFILGAVLTTPEVVTQVLMAIPLLGLYELSVWVAWYWEHPDPRKARKQLLLVFALIALAIALIWVGWHYGIPWLRTQGYDLRLPWKH
ncbi:MAG TPA: twin-arginine translocase subunit TatC [Candidatus Paceibacterota bacterium]|nr:twin-arginine translocase subunit TatC [Candidatus Paceibacterota bacterium]